MADVIDWQELFDRRRASVVPAAVPPPPPGTGSAYAEAALLRETAAVAGAAEGSRNHTLNVAAFNLGQLVAAGLLDAERVTDALTVAALAAGLAAGEVRATVHSGLRAGAQEPRMVAELPGPDVSEVASLDGAAARTVTSWRAMRLGERAEADAGAPEACYLLRTDGAGLLYPGKVNGLLGESESGKSWLALLAVAQVAAAGEHVLILDFEDSPASVLERIRALGVDVRALTDPDAVHYAHPDEALGLAQSADLMASLAEQAPGLIVVDGVNAAMTLLGLDLNSNADATAFTLRLLRPLAATGACVVTVDHVPKNPEQRGKGGIGAQAKRAMIDGCALRVEVVEPFGRGQSGELRISVDKDRPGRVRGLSAQGSQVGRAILTSTGDDVSLRIENPSEVAPAIVADNRLAEVMESISVVLESTPGISGRSVTDMIPARAAVVREALQTLIDEGFVATFSGARRAVLHRSIRPFRRPVAVVEEGVGGGV